MVASLIIQCILVVGIHLGYPIGTMIRAAQIIFTRGFWRSENNLIVGLRTKDSDPKISLQLLRRAKVPKGEQNQVKELLLHLEETC